MDVGKLQLFTKSPGMQASNPWSWWTGFKQILKFLTFLTKRLSTFVYKVPYKVPLFSSPYRMRPFVRSLSSQDERDQNSY